jgi:hypothetical protein
VKSEKQSADAILNTSLTSQAYMSNPTEVQLRLRSALRHRPPQHRPRERRGGAAHGAPAGTVPAPAQQIPAPAPAAAPVG